MRGGIRQSCCPILAACGAILAVCVGCGSPFDTDGTDAAGPSLDFAPQSRKTDINLDRDHDADDRHAFTLFVVVNGFQLAAPHKCGTTPNCGHLLLHIDGTSCGDPNDLSTDERLHARFGRCRSVSGRHVITIQLRDDGERLLAMTELEVMVTSSG